MFGPILGTVIVSAGNKVMLQPHTSNPRYVISCNCGRCSLNLRIRLGVSVTPNHLLVRGITTELLGVLLVSGVWLLWGKFYLLVSGIWLLWGKFYLFTGYS